MDLDNDASSTPPSSPMSPALSTSTPNSSPPTSPIPKPRKLSPSATSSYPKATPAFISPLQRKQSPHLPNEIITRIIHFLDQLLSSPSTYNSTSNYPRSLDHGLRHRGSRSRLAPYASISKDWQAAVEQITFSRLTLSVAQLPEATAFVARCPRRHYVRDVRFSVVLAPREPTSLRPEARNEAAEGAGSGLDGSGGSGSSSAGAGLGGSRGSGNGIGGGSCGDINRRGGRTVQDNKDYRDGLVFQHSVWLFAKWLHAVTGDASDPVGQNLSLTLSSTLQTVPPLRAGRGSEMGAWAAGVSQKEKMTADPFPLWSEEAMVMPDLSGAAAAVRSFKFAQNERGASHAHLMKYRFLFDMISQFRRMESLEMPYWDHYASDHGLMVARRLAFAENLLRLPPSVRKLKIEYYRLHWEKTTQTVDLVPDGGLEDPFSTSLRAISQQLEEFTITTGIIGRELFWPLENDAHIEILPGNHARPSRSKSKSPSTSTSRIARPTPSHRTQTATPPPTWPHLHTLNIQYIPLTPQGKSLKDGKSAIDTALFEDLYGAVALAADQMPRLSRLDLRACSNNSGSDLPWLTYRVDRFDRGEAQARLHLLAFKPGEKVMALWEETARRHTGRWDGDEEGALEVEFELWRTF